MEKLNYDLYKKVLNALREYCFENFASHEACIDEVIEYYDDKELPLSDWNYGATKMVLQPKGKNFVVKIPFKGDLRYEVIYDENGPTEEYEDVFVPFYNSCSEIKWDYCLKEVEVYKAAVASGLEAIFVETFCIGDVHNHPIYVQERVDQIGGENHRSKAQKKSASDTIEKYGLASNYLDLEWVSTFLEYYGEQKLITLYEFLEEENIADDLHNGNIGYLRGKPVIFDYSGYNE